MIECTLEEGRVEKRGMEGISLQRRGAKIQSGPQMAPHGIREMVIEDLNGYRLAFGELGR